MIGMQDIGDVEGVRRPVEGSGAAEKVKKTGSLIQIRFTWEGESRRAR
jgi:hypothetical protein